MMPRVDGDRRDEAPHRVISKPFDLDELLRHVRDCIAR
jgi:hypothetical protein